MTKLTVSVVLVGVCLSPTVMAKKQPYDGYGRVIQTTPVYEYIAHRVPVQSCEIQHGHPHRPSNPSHNSIGPAIVGGVIGGAVGHAIGSSHGNKQVGVIAGSIIGATIGANINHGDSRPQRRPEPERDCSVTYRVEHEQVLVGYDVMYHYQGHRYHTHTKQHPGPRIRLPFDDRHDKKHKQHSNSIVFKPKDNDKKPR